MSSFRLDIFTPNGTYFSGFVQYVNIDTEMGYITVLREHLPLVAPVRVSKLHIKDEDGNIRLYAIGGGILQVKENEVVLLLNSIESQEEIDQERAELAMHRAKARMDSRDENLDLIRAEAALKRALNRLRVKGKL